MTKIDISVILEIWIVEIQIFSQEGIAKRRYLTNFQTLTSEIFLFLYTQTKAVKKELGLFSFWIYLLYENQGHLYLYIYGDYRHLSVETSTVQFSISHFRTFGNFDYVHI